MKHTLLTSFAAFALLAATSVWATATNPVMSDHYDVIVIGTGAGPAESHLRRQNEEPVFKANKISEVIR